jgi:hypothetical protein
MGAFSFDGTPSGIPERLSDFPEGSALPEGTARIMSIMSVILPVYLHPGARISATNRVDNWHYVYQT